MIGVRALESGDPEEVGGFALRGRIGSGRQAIVYLGMNAYGAAAAIKVPHPDRLTDRHALDSFEREAGLLGLAPDTLSPRLYDHGWDGERRYLASEFLDSPSLEQVIEADGPFRGDDLRRFAVGVSGLLAALHELGIHHGDLKPRHVMVGPGPRMFLIDFGVADIDDARLRRRDLFCLAAVILYAATGRFPYEGTPLELLTRAVDGRPGTDSLPSTWREPIRACLDLNRRSCPNAMDVLLAVSR